MGIYKIETVVYENSRLIGLPKVFAVGVLHTPRRIVQTTEVQHSIASAVEAESILRMRRLLVGGGTVEIVRVGNLY